METVILVVHLMLVSALVALVLLQRSEGGALGIGGGGNFMASRGTGNVLTRATTYLAAGFFVTSIALTIIAKVNDTSGSILDAIPAAGAEGAAPGPNQLLDMLPPAVPTEGGVAPAVPAATPEAAPAPAVPAGGTPTVPTGAAPAPTVPTQGATPPTVPADAAPPPVVPEIVPGEAPAPAVPGG